MPSASPSSIAFSAVQNSPENNVLSDPLSLPARRWELAVSNDSARPLWFEAEFNDFDGLRADARLGRRDGRPLWRVLVPANGRVVLNFRDRIPR